MLTKSLPVTQGPPVQKVGSDSSSVAKAITVLIDLGELLIILLTKKIATTPVIIPINIPKGIPITFAPRTIYVSYQNAGITESILHHQRQQLRSDNFYWKTHKVKRRYSGREDLTIGSKKLHFSNDFSNLAKANSTPNDRI
jgi:hypothetical protein